MIGFQSPVKVSSLRQSYIQKQLTKGTADRLLSALVDLDTSLSGYQVKRLGQTIQAATRAWRDGADID